MKTSGLNALHAWLEIRPTNNSQNGMLLQMGKIGPRFVYDKHTIQGVSTNIKTGKYENVIVPGRVGSQKLVQEPKKRKQLSLLQ